MAQRKLRAVSSWMAESRFEKDFGEDLLECRLIVLKIIRFMKENHLTQKELAERLNVSPQYINKFLHGRDLDMKVSTILRYGRVLGIKLIEVPSDSQEARSSIYGSIRVKAEQIQPSQFTYLSSVFVPSPIKSSAREDRGRSGRHLS